MSRLPLLNAEDLAPQDRDVVATGMNLHRALAHSPGLARMSRQLGLYLRNTSGLDARLRELAILQVAYASRSPYEYSHHLKIARDLGMPDSDLDAIATESAGETSGLDARARLVLRAAREAATGPAVSAETFAALAAELPADQLVDLVFAITFYCGFVRLTGSLGLEVEPSYQLYLDRFPLPAGA